MDKKNFYREQAEQFRDYLDKSPDRDLLSLFEEWAESKDFSDEDREAVFAKYLSHFAKKKDILIPRLKIHLRDDPIALRDIVNVILLALELAEKKERDKKE